MKTKMTVAAVMTALNLAGSAARADGLVVNDWESTAVDSSLPIGMRLICSGPFAYGIEKTGDGSWTLPLDNLATKNPLTVLVRSGKVEITDNDGTPSVESAPSVLDSALFWVAADKNVVADGASVSRWYDVRETLSSGAWGNRHPVAVAVKPAWKSEMAYPELRKESSRDMIWFGGSVSAGVTMRFHDAADRDLAVTLSGIREVFVVTRFSGFFGNVLGSRSGANQYFQSGSIGNMAGTYLARSAKLTVPSGVNSLNGRLFDPRTTIVKSGTQLLNYHHPARNDITVDYFFNDREMENRAGGEYLCEVVFFQQELTTEERAEVECYLTEKWGIECDRTRVDIKIARGAEAEIGDLSGGFTVFGHGSLTLRNAGVPRFDDTDRRSGFYGGLNVAEGTVTVGAAALQAAALSGTAMTAQKRIDGGDYIVSAAAGTEGCVKISVADEAKKVNGVVRLGSVPETVTNIAASAEVFSLAAERELPDNAELSAVQGSREATFFDPGFESASANQVIKEEGTYGGWTYSSLRNAEIYLYQVHGWWCDYDPPEGRFAMGVKFPNASPLTARATTKVTVHSKGAYELSFKTCGRYTTSILQTAISLEKADGTVYPLGSVTSYPLLGYSSRRYRTPVLEPGEYTLALDSTSLGDSMGMFDDFKMTLAPDQDRTEIFPVPHGTFGKVSYTSDYKQLNQIHSWNTADGWTFTLGGRGALNSGCPSVGVTSIGMKENFVYNSGSSRYGDTQLTFWDGDGVATSDVFTTLPKGRWRLRCRVSRWGLSDYWPGKGVMLTAAASPVFAASIVVNGTERQLGTVGAEDFIFARRTFPGVVEVASGDSVAVVLKQTATDAAGQLDDVEFVRVDDEELVANGGFEDSAAWVFVKNNATTAPKSDARILTYGDVGNFGHTRHSGSKALVLVDLGAAEQDLQFTEPGVYRLSFWVRARFYGSPSVYPNKFRHGGNRVRASLADETGNVSEIMLTQSLYETNFVECTALFNVPKSDDGGPIRRKLRLEGINDTVAVRPGKLGWHDDLNAIIDEVSVRKAAQTEISLNKALSVNLNSSAVLNLDFAGTNEVREVRIGGRRLSGTISAATYPGLVSGIGTLYAAPPGFLLIVK